MTIDRLREVLGAAGPPPDARELSEMLWLACHISPPDEEPPAPPPVPPPQGFADPADAPGPATPPARVPPPPPPPPPLTALHPRTAPDIESAGQATEVLVPTAPMLADPLGVQRALRPLKRRVPSRHRVELDEDATAARIADTRLWTPVLVPEPERWLGLSLVVDTGPTMRLWRPLARELAETLLRQGAFQDVHVSYLGTTGRITSTPDAPPQDPGTLLDGSGRQAVLVLSDCSGPHWWDGRAARAVRRWAQAGPTAILQPLAERLWRRTAAPVSPGSAFLPRPGAPNTDLRFTPYDGAAAPGVPVPVLEVAPRWFGAWARLVSGSDPQPAAVATLPSRPSGTDPLTRERELPVDERVRRFLATASPDAAELAAHVAVSVPSLPVMRLIQHRILGGSGPGQLAEVLLSGLLRPAGGVRYEFVPGAREALLDTLPRPEALHTRHVLEAVSAEIERRAGTSAETFRALLPTEGGPVTLTTDTGHFALLTPETRTHLAPAAQPRTTAAPPTPEAADIPELPEPPDLLEPPDLPDLLDLLDLLGDPVDELIGDEWDRRPHPTLIGVENNGDPVWVDILGGNPDLPHGLILGLREAPEALLRTIVFSLALGHSPNIVNLAFVDLSHGLTFAGLGRLPHVVTAVHSNLPDSSLLSRLTEALETERSRREAVLRAVRLPTWDAYQSAVARGRELEPLPALIVAIDNIGPFLDAQPDVIEPLSRLCEAGPVQGIKFIFHSPNDQPPPTVASLVGWQITAPGTWGPGTASLHTFGQSVHPGFRPAHMALEAGAPIVEAMRRRGPHARRLNWPDEPEAPPSPSSPPVVLPESDVLSLNGGHMGTFEGTFERTLEGTFEENWTQPAIEPRDPAIGHDPDGNVVTLYPLDISSGIPHGLIVGETAARQRTVRNIALALAANYSPRDLTFAFAGLGDHPLGEPLDLPHVRFSDDELLGRPRRLQVFIEYLSAELDARAASRSAGNPGLVVFADVSLTFPSSRPEVGEVLLKAAQRGRALGVQLLVSSSTVEGTTIWNRFLPLLGWRIAAGRMPPSLQRVLGQAGLPFPDERTAYLLAGGGSPRQFTLAPDPPGSAVQDFVHRATRAHTDASLRELLGTDAAAREEETSHEALGAIFGSDWSRGGHPRHLVFEGPNRPAMSRTAQVYGQMLAALGVLSHGNVHEVSISSSGHILAGADPDTTIAGLFARSRGGVLLIQLSDAHPHSRPIGLLDNELRALMDEHGEDPVVVLRADADQILALRQADPFFTDRFRRIGGFR